MGVMPVAAHTGEVIPLNQFILCNCMLGINSSLCDSKRKTRLPSVQELTERVLWQVAPSDCAQAD